VWIPGSYLVREFSKHLQGLRATQGRKHKITGTPTLIFSNSTRVPGAIDNKRVEQLLAQAAKP
jgi:predicted DsbA family dithiol-disulfide isomerase